jgi:predicted GNAT superfamily acetyltransferase
VQVRLELQHCQTTDRKSMRGRGHARSIPEVSFELAIGPGYAVLGSEISLPFPPAKAVLLSL